MQNKLNELNAHFCPYMRRSQKVRFPILLPPNNFSQMPLYALKVQTLVARWKHFRSSSSAIFVDDAVPQWVLFCVCRHKKMCDQIFGICGQKGQRQLKFMVKFKQFMAQMWWPCSMCKNGVGNLVAVAWVWQMNKGADVLPHQQTLS